MKKLEVWLDIDGVLADFTRSAIRVNGVDPETFDYQNMTWDFHNQLGIPVHQFWAAIDAHGPEFWELLSEYPWTRDLVGYLELYGYTLLTSPSLSEHSVAGKVRWIKRKFGDNFRSWMICPTGKHKVVAGKHSLLIDDSDANCDAWAAAGGTALLFPQPYNKNRDKVDNRYDYVVDYIELLEESLS